MSTKKMLEAYERFAAGFLHPLLTGGTVELGRPIGPGCVETFAHARPGDPTIDQEIYAAIYARGSTIAPVRGLPYPDRGTLALAIACHDLMVVTDPMLDRVFARGHRRRILEWVERLCELAGPPETRGQALSRHAVVSRALTVERTDVVIKNWAYTYRFFGRPIPPRVVAMPRLRFVKRNESKQTLLALLASLEQADVPARSALRRLLASSPITELLRFDLASDFRFGGAAVAVLSDPSIRYGIARELVDQGLDAYDEPLGDALAALRADQAPPAVLYYVLAFVLELIVLDTLNARGEPSPLHHQTPGAALFGAVLPAVLGSPCALDPLVELAAPDMDKLRRRAQAHDAAIEPGTIQIAIPLVRNAQPPAEAPPMEVHAR